MASIALDPRILAAPKADSSREQIYAFVNRLLCWQSFANELGCAVVVTRDAAVKLAEDGAYPMPAALRKQMIDVGVIEYDMATLQRLCELFLNPKVSFQDYVCVDALLYENTSFSPVLPAYPHLPATTEEAESNAVALAVLDHCGCAENVCGLAVEVSPGSAAMQVAAQLHEISHRRQDLDTLNELPAQIAGTVSISTSLGEFAACADFGRLLSSADNDDQIRLCIKLAVYARRVAINSEAEWDELPTINIGADFRLRSQQVAGLNASHGANIVETIVDILENTNNGQTHVLRTGEGGNNPQRKVRDYGAWRRDVAKDVHVHYWKGPKGNVELSWVSHPHNDFYIADGTTF